MSNAITSAEVSQGGHYNISNGSGDCSGDERDRGRYAGGVQVAAEEVVMVVWEIVVEEKDTYHGGNCGGDNGKNGGRDNGREANLLAVLFLVISEEKHSS